MTASEPQMREVGKKRKRQPQSVSGDQVTSRQTGETLLTKEEEYSESFVWNEVQVKFTGKECEAKTVQGKDQSGTHDSLPQTDMKAKS